MFKIWCRVAVTALAVAGVNWAAAPAHPGTINYIDGQAAVDGRPVTPMSSGDADVGPGQVLSVDRGRAEMLLTPGVFLRIGRDTAVKMISPDLTDTQVQLLHGNAMVEVTNLQKENDIRVLDQQASVKFEKNGLYAIEGNRVEVLDGKAQVSEDGRTVDVKAGHEVDLNGSLKSKHFDKKVAENNDPLYSWSAVRSEYLSEESASMAQSYLVNPGGWVGAGWYWGPGWDMWSFLPGAGFAYSPFGWGFYSPVYYGSYFYGPRYLSRGGYIGRGMPPHARVVTPRASSGFGGRAFGGGSFGGGRSMGSFHGGGGRR